MAVARIVQIKPVRASAPRYTAGPNLKFLPLTTNGSAGGGPTIPVDAIICHGEDAYSRFRFASVGDALEIGDVVRTSPNILLAIEFLIGGRVGVNFGSAVKVVSERTVADADISYSRIILSRAVSGLRLFI